MSALQWAYYDCFGSLPYQFNDFWGGHQPRLEIDDPDSYAGDAGRARQDHGMNMMNLVAEAAADAPGVFAEVPRAARDAAGPARLISHPSQGNRLHPGEVLVAPSTDPAWTPLFLKASAIVMETGGFLSHGAIVAREYGIPAVVNVAGAMRIIRDGQEIAVDGEAGTVHL